MDSKYVLCFCTVSFNMQDKKCKGVKYGQKIFAKIVGEHCQNLNVYTQHFYQFYSKSQQYLINVFLQPPPEPPICIRVSSLLRHSTSQTVHFSDTSQTSVGLLTLIIVFDSSFTTCHFPDIPYLRKLLLVSLSRHPRISTSQYSDISVFRHLSLESSIR